MVLLCPFMAGRQAVRCPSPTTATCCRVRGAISASVPSPGITTSSLLPPERIVRIVGGEGHLTHPSTVPDEASDLPGVLLTGAVQLPDLDLAELDAPSADRVAEGDVAADVTPLGVDVVCGRLPVQQDGEDVAVGDHLEREPATGRDRPRLAVGTPDVVMGRVAGIEGPGPVRLPASRRVDQRLVAGGPVRIAGWEDGSDRTIGNRCLRCRRSGSAPRCAGECPGSRRARNKGGWLRSWCRQ